MEQEQEGPGEEGPGEEGLRQRVGGSKPEVGRVYARGWEVLRRGVELL